MSFMGNDDMSDGVCFEMPVAEVARIINAARIAQAKLQADAPLVIPDIVELSKKGNLHADMPEETRLELVQRFSKEQWARDWAATLYKSKNETDKRLEDLKNSEGRIKKEHEEYIQKQSNLFRQLKEIRALEPLPESLLERSTRGEVDKVIDKTIGELSPTRDPNKGIIDLYGERLKEKASADASDKVLTDLYSERVQKR